MHYLKVADAEDSEPIEVPTEEDGTLPVPSLSNLYPGASGLTYSVDGHTRAVRLSEGKLLPPDEGWGDHVYYCFFPRDGNSTKRKADDVLETSGTKSSRVDSTTPKTETDTKNKDANNSSSWTYTDLVVLGLAWKTTDKTLHDYFSKFGELQMAQVKVDPVTKKSKGFGFVRFTNNEVQVRVMLQRHQIDGRWCDVRVPLSREGAVKKAPCKIFVGQCTEDITEDILKDYFIKFGEITDVYVPRPFRGFAFVTFTSPDAVTTICNQTHHVNGKRVVVTEAIPKSTAKEPRRSSSSRSGGRYGGGGGSGGMGGGSYRGGRDAEDYFRDRYEDDYGRRDRGGRRGGGGDAFYRREAPVWRSRSPVWNRGAGNTWGDKPSPDRNLHTDLVAKVVNKAVIGVIENLKSTSPEVSDPNAGAYREDWFSRR